MKYNKYLQEYLVKTFNENFFNLSDDTMKDIENSLGFKKYVFRKEAQILVKSINELILPIKYFFIDRFKESKILDYIQEELIYSKFKVISKAGIKFWNYRMK